MKKLNRKQALKLLPLVVDNEATEEQKKAFFNFIQRDAEVKKKYESLLFVKQLLKNKYSRENAPDHLKKKISNIIQDLEWEKKQKSKVDNPADNIGSSTPNPQQHDKDVTDNTENGVIKSTAKRLMAPVRYLVAASVIFIFSLLTIEFLEQMSTDRILNYKSVEQVALSHFSTGSHVDASFASFQPASHEHASELLQDEISYSPRLPDIKGASLRNIYYTPFSGEYKIPVLVFYQEEIGETIHVFAFKIDDLEDKPGIKRDAEAVKLCKTYDDYHIKEIKNKHIVSWKWGDYWYTAVSNHNGKDLIALVEPVENQEDGDNGW
ncbi:MAG: hypothetical protein ACQERO_12075 [Bacteroidota bacterium]